MVVDDEEGTTEDDVHVKLSNEEVWEVIEMCLTYSLFLENGEIGAMPTKISPVAESEVIRFSKQMIITDFFNK